jgi:hypothetical protein
MGVRGHDCLFNALIKRSFLSMECDVLMMLEKELPLGPEGTGNLADTDKESAKVHFFSRFLKPVLFRKLPP